MREDLLEELEDAYPNGFVFLYIDGAGTIRESGCNMDKSRFLTAYYHLGLALSCMFNGQAED